MPAKGGGPQQALHQAGQSSCSMCGLTKPLDDFYMYPKSRTIFNKCRACMVIWRRAHSVEYGAFLRTWRARLKAEVLAAYGGLCACCGEPEPAFLTVDHIYQDGKEHRKTVPAGKFYTWLKANGFPKDRFRLLCFNCNCARRFFKGVCPHEMRLEGGGVAVPNF